MHAIAFALNARRRATNKGVVMTAYRQQALACAMALQGGPLRPRDLRHIAPAAGRILRSNLYGWFARTEPGVYRLTPLGEAAVHRWASGPEPHAGAAERKVAVG
jgi:hypothetical protein